MAKPRTAEPNGPSTAETSSEFLPANDDIAGIGNLVFRRLKDQDFDDCYGRRGPLPISPMLLVLVTLVQFLERLPDRAASRRVRYGLDLKIAAGLPADYPGFHFSILSEFRQRLVESDKARLIFDRVLDELKSLGLISSGGRQRIDATHVVGCVRQLTRIELVTEALRPAVLAFERMLGEEEAKRLLPQELALFAGVRPDLRKLDKAAQRRTLTEAGRHAAAFLALVEGCASDPVKGLEEVAVLRTILKQQFKVVADRVEVLTDKEFKETPGPVRGCTPLEPEARYSEKRGKSWIGYKVQITETSEEDRPNFITDVQEQNAAVPDRAGLEPVIESLKKNDLMPEKLDADQGYVSGETIDTLKEEHGIDLRGPVAEEPDRGVFKQSEFQDRRGEARSDLPRRQAKRFLVRRGQRRYVGELREGRLRVVPNACELHTREGPAAPDGERPSRDVDGT